MSITNHLLAGTLIGLVIHNSAIAIPLGYTSHFIMDAIPHFGYPTSMDFASAIKEMKQHKAAYIYSIGTVITFLLTFLVLLLTRHLYALLIGLVAVSPDAIMTAYYYFKERKGQTTKGLFAWVNLKFHGRIQFERPWAISVEIFSFFTLSYFVNVYLT